VTMLNEKGIPTPLVHTMLCPPRSRMDVLTDAEIDKIVSHSKLVAKYNQSIDSQSAYEILTGKLQDASQTTAAQTQTQKSEKAPAGHASNDGSFLDSPMMKQVERTAASVLTRSLLGVLGLGGRSRSRKTF